MTGAKYVSDSCFQEKALRLKLENLGDHRPTLVHYKVRVESLVSDLKQLICIQHSAFFRLSSTFVLWTVWS